MKIDPIQTSVERPRPVSIAVDDSPDLATIQAWKRFGLAAAGLSLLWLQPLLTLGQLAFRHDLYSHVLLVPAVSAYLVWIDRKQLPRAGGPAVGWAIGLALAMATSLALGWLSPAGPESGRLAWWILAYVFGIAGAGSLTLGRETMRCCVFSFAFLVFVVPPPPALVQICEVALQHASAEAADWLFVATGTPSIRNGLYFRLPGLQLEVAQECSGFRSTLVLFIVSWVAGKMFLRTSWKRAVLVLVIVPLGIFRNAFRIYTLAALSINLDPEIMNSALHHRGGPLFFLISLIPLNLILWILYRSDRNRRQPNISSPSQSTP